MSGTLGFVCSWSIQKEFDIARFGDVTQFGEAVGYGAYEKDQSTASLTPAGLRNIGKRLCLNFKS